MSIQHSICPACGAAWPEGQSCEDAFHACLALEFSDPAYGAVHNLTVPAYYLQHPSLLSRQGWEEMHRTLTGFLVEGVSVGRMRRRSNETLDSGRRDFSLRKGAPMELAGVRWTHTIAAVCLDNAEAYRSDVRRWAQAVLTDLKTVHSNPKDSAR